MQIWINLAVLFPSKIINWYVFFCHPVLVVNLIKMESKIYVVKLEVHDTCHGRLKNECVDSAGLVNESDVGSESCAIETKALQGVSDLTKHEFFTMIKTNIIMNSVKKVIP